MKKEYKCVVCGKTFIAQKKTNLKTCTICRGSINNIRRFKIRQKNLKENINSKFIILQIINTNGEFYLKIKNNYFLKLNNSVVNMTNKDLYIKFIKQTNEYLKKDLNTIKKLNNFNGNKSNV